MQIDSERLLESAVEDRVASGIGEIRQDDRVFLGKRAAGGPCRARTDVQCAGNYGDADESSGKDISAEFFSSCTGIGAADTAAGGGRSCRRMGFGIPFQASRPMTGSMVTRQFE